MRNGCDAATYASWSDLQSFKFVAECTCCNCVDENASSGALRDDGKSRRGAGGFAQKMYTCVGQCPAGMRHVQCT